jgi:hypothetical protein
MSGFVFIVSGVASAYLPGRHLVSWWLNMDIHQAKLPNNALLHLLSTIQAARAQLHLLAAGVQNTICCQDTVPFGAVVRGTERQVWRPPAALFAGPFFDATDLK